MRAYRLYQVDSFTKTKLLGNPAGVVANADGLTPEEMQQIARELNNSETAFLLSPLDATHDVWVRFFTPSTEVPICGHATIAAHYVRALEKRLGNVRVLQKTGAGILPVDIVHDGDDYQMVMTQGAVVFGSVLESSDISELCSALGITPADLRADCPVQVVSTGHSKVMVALREPALLQQLRPDLERLSALSARIGCNGYYLFTLHPGEEAAVHGRMFAPAIGIAEDPVTGNANGPLGAYLAHYRIFSPQGDRLVFTAVQGEAIHRPGSMEVRVRLSEGEPVEVQIAGYAAVAFATTLLMDER